MIIGVDAGALSITDERLRVGVWRVTYNLLKELAKVDKTNEYRLYTFTPIGERFGENFKNVVVRPKIGWASLQLPIELRRHPVDVFLGLSQMAPRLPSLRSGIGGQARSPVRTIGFIYDVGFLRHPEAYPGSVNRLKKQTRQLVERADHIVAISNVTKTDIEANYDVQKPITVAYPGVDARFTRRGLKHREKNPYILFVGALKPGKNVPMAMRIFKRFLQKSKKTYDFVIVGGNYWEDPEIDKTIAREGLANRVKRKGFVPDKELPEYYRGAEALLVTSLWEGFCLPAAEAMACGCPVVYIKHGSLPEIVRRGGSAFETEQEAVEVLIRPKRTHTRVRFSWERFARQVYQLL